MAEKVERMKLGRSPKGVAVYPRLDKPDTKFDVGGVYKVGLRVNPNEPEAAAYIAKIAKFAADNPKAVGNNANSPVKAHADDNGVPTGDVVISFKVAATWPDGSSRKPAIVDASKKELNANVGGGSVIRVSGEAATYTGFGGGVTLAPKAIQVLDLKTWNPGVEDFDDEGVADADADAWLTQDGGGDDEPEF